MQAPPLGDRAYTLGVHVVFDQQIFAIQEYGGISRLFAELATEFTMRSSLDVSLNEINMSTRNHYLLADPELARALLVRPARTVHGPLMRYLGAPRRHTTADLTHATFYLTRGLKDYAGVPRVVTVHDMIPELFPASERRLDRITDKRRFVESADHVICVSHSTRDDLLRIYGDIQVPISVIPHGVDPIFAPAANRLTCLPENYILFVGKRSGYKDAELLIRAFADLQGDFPGLSLVMVGGGSLNKIERSLISKLRVLGKVHQTTIQDRDMPAAYSGAIACVFPSRYEGFGFPALEAMACGTPLIAAAASALPEVGGDAPSYFIPGDQESLASALDRVLANDELRYEMSRLGRARAQQFTWKRTASLTANVYLQVLSP